MGIMRGSSRVIIFGKVTQMQVNQPKNGSNFNVTILVEESYYIKSNTGASEKKEFHKVVIYGSSAQTASEHLNVGDLFYTDSGMLRTSEIVQGGKTTRMYKIITFDIQINTDTKPKQVSFKAEQSIKQIKETIKSGKKQQDLL